MVRVSVVPRTALCDQSSEVMAKGFKFTFELRPFVLDAAGEHLLGLIAWLDLVLVLHCLVPYAPVNPGAEIGGLYKNF